MLSRRSLNALLLVLAATFWLGQRFAPVTQTPKPARTQDVPPSSTVLPRPTTPLVAPTVTPRPTAFPPPCQTTVRIPPQGCYVFKTKTAQERETYYTIWHLALFSADKQTTLAIQYKITDEYGNLILNGDGIIHVDKGRVGHPSLTQIVLSAGEDRILTVHR